MKRFGTDHRRRTPKSRRLGLQVKDGRRGRDQPAQRRNSRHGQ